MCELCAALSAGGSVDGDALGGDMSAFAALRVFLPPLFPSIRLGNAGIRTQFFTCVGTLTPKPTASSFLIDCTFRKAIVIAGSCVNRCNGFVGANSLVVWRGCGPYPDLVPCFRSFLSLLTNEFAGYSLDVNTVTANSRRSGPSKAHTRRRWLTDGVGVVVVIPIASSRLLV
jgi:hypothetical protein